MTRTANGQRDDNERIASTIEQYVAGARSGRGDDMRPAFREGAMIFGHFGDELLAGPIEQLFAWNDANGPAPDLKAEIVRIDRAGRVAAVRVELHDWTGQRFTDLFTLLEQDGEWKIVNKVFHLH